MEGVGDLGTRRSCRELGLQQLRGCPCTTNAMEGHVPFLVPRLGPSFHSEN